jgi:hypothetical protein
VLAEMKAILLQLLNVEQMKVNQQFLELIEQEGLKVVENLMHIQL